MITREKRQSEICAFPGPLSLRSNFIWTFAGNVIYASCQWGILAVLAKLGTTVMVGQFALGLAISAPIMAFALLNLRTVQATDSKKDFEFCTYRAVRILAVGIALTLVGVYVALSSFSRQTAFVVLIVSAMKGIDALSDVYYGLWQQHERMDGIAQSLILNGIVSTVALTALMSATHNIVLATLGTLGGSTVTLVFTILRNNAVVPYESSGKQLMWGFSSIWRITVIAAPLGFASLLISLNSNIPRYIIEWKLGASELGVYAALMYLVTAGATIVTALGQSVTPRLAQLYSTMRVKETRDLSFRLLAIGVGIGVSGICLSLFFGESLLCAIYRPEYARESQTFVWVMVLAALTYIAYFLNYIINATRRFAAQSLITFGVVVVTAISSVILVPRCGLLGAIWSGIISIIFQLGVSSVYLSHIFNDAARRLSDNSMPSRPRRC